MQCRLVPAIGPKMICDVSVSSEIFLIKEKTLISTSNLYKNVNPVTVLNSACSEDSKTPPTCWNWSSFARVIWGQRQMISFSKLPVKWYNWENFLLKLTFCHKKCCVHLETFQNKEKNIFEMPVRCLGCLISWFWVKMSRILEISS